MRTMHNSTVGRSGISRFTAGCLISIFVFLGCTKQVIVTTVLDSPPSAMIRPLAADVQPTEFKRTMRAAVAATWPIMVDMLVSSSLVVEASEIEDLVFFIEIAGFYHRNKLYFAEFPMIAVIGAVGDSLTQVSVLPLTEQRHLPSSVDVKNSYIDAQAVQAREFLDRLSCEIEGPARWPWLWSSELNATEE